MLVIFCADPLRRGQPDPTYASEYAAAQAAGLAVALLSYEALVDDDDAAEALRRIAPTPAGEPPTLAIYRGWMLRPPVYAKLYAALAARGVALINTPDAYRVCHYLPDSYPYIADHTPATVWLPLPADRADLDMAQVMRVLRPFGAAPLILKDYVKSRKHEWNTACYIPSAADTQAVERVASAFLRLQGPDLNEGLVFRAYTPLQPLGVHSQSGMPLACEYRRFYLDALDGAPLATSAYWAVEDPAGVDDAPPSDLFAEVARRIPSRCFTMDVARTLAGEWMIVELGDGQVAGLPERLPAAKFYGALAARALRA